MADFADLQRAIGELTAEEQTVVITREELYRLTTGDRAQRQRYDTNVAELAAARRHIADLERQATNRKRLVRKLQSRAGEGGETIQRLTSELDASWEENERLKDQLEEVQMTADGVWEDVPFGLQCVLIAVHPENRENGDLAPPQAERERGGGVTCG